MSSVLRGADLGNRSLTLDRLGTGLHVDTDTLSDKKSLLDLHQALSLTNIMCRCDLLPRDVARVGHNPFGLGDDSDAGSIHKLHQVVTQACLRCVPLAGVHLLLDVVRGIDRVHEERPTVSLLRSLDVWYRRAVLVLASVGTPSAVERERSGK